MMGKPAESFHPSEFIADELKARGWDFQELAMRMHWNDIASSMLALELYKAGGSDAEIALSMRLGEMADHLDRAFGASPGFFANLERDYLNARGVEVAQGSRREWPYERCKDSRCDGRRSCVGFRVDDDIWNRVVPPALRDRVVCLECFDERAQALGIAYDVREVFPVTWSAPSHQPDERAPNVDRVSKDPTP